MEGGYPQATTTTMGTLLGSLGEVVTAVIGYVGDICTEIVSQPILLLTMGILLLGGAIGIFGRLLSRGGLIFMYMGFQTSMAIIMFHGFIKNIPEELEEAATIDGCGSIRLFISIVLPLMRTIIVTVAVINVMGTWNDFLLPSLIINKQGLQTLPLKTYLFFGQFAKRWDLASAGLVMCMAPIIIFYLFSQKYIVKGITEGAIK